jgi:hypothetical protein
MKKLLLNLSLAALPLLPATALAADPCLDCHLQKTPGAVRQWQASAHAGKVGCADCHGADHQRIVAGEAVVDTRVCGRCHEEALHQHVASRHGMGLHSGWGCTRKLLGRDPKECRFCHEEGSTRPLSTVHCARFLKQTSEMGEAGCNRCHDVESSCASCHTSHNTDLRIVRDPAVCAKCHMGPDHPQWEMWQTSQHGTLYATAGPQVGPSCQTCHMPSGTHDVSRGLTATPGMALYPDKELAARRDAMVQVCTACHAERFAREELSRGDAIRDQSLALAKEADAVVWDLFDRGLLDPMPQQRPPHPLSGPTLVTDSQMLYEETSHIERLLFKMKKYDLAKTVKGAYHQNPAYTHWYGNAELKMDLVDIRAEASRLRQKEKAVAAPAATGPQEEVERKLAVLKSRFERKAISAEEYAREKARLLEQFSGK